MHNWFVTKNFILQNWVRHQRNVVKGKGIQSVTQKNRSLILVILSQNLIMILMNLHLSGKEGKHLPKLFQRIGIQSLLLLQSKGTWNIPVFLSFIKVCNLGSSVALSVSACQCLSVYLPFIKVWQGLSRYTYVCYREYVKPGISCNPWSF